MKSTAKKRQATAVIAVPLLIGVALALLQATRRDLPNDAYLERRGAELQGESDPGWSRDYTIALLEGEQFTDADLARLLSFPNLERVSLKDSSVTDEGLKVLKDLPELLRLDWSGTKITGEGLEALVGCRRLWEVQLNQCPHIDARDLKVLAKSKSISLIHYDWRDWRDAPPEVVLELLDVFGKRFPFQLVECFRAPKWGQIRTSDYLDLDIYVDPVEAELGTSAEALQQALMDLPFRRLVAEVRIGGDWTNAHGDRLALLAETFPNLKRFYQARVSDADLIALGQCRHLVSLKTVDMYYPYVASSQAASSFTDAGLSALGGLSQLTELHLGSRYVAGPGLEAVGRLHSLKTLALALPSADGSAISSWEGLSDLTSLQLELGPQAKGEGLEAIGRLRSLENVRLTAPGANAEFLSAWTGFQQLDSLYLAIAQLDGKRLAPLAQIKCLGSLELPEAGLSDGAVESIEAVLGLHKQGSYNGHVFFGRSD